MTKIDETLQTLLSEFRGLTNDQAYEIAFHKKLMRPDPDRPGHFLGNTQREDFLKYLTPIINAIREKFESELDSELEPDRFARPPLQVFDFGAGAGDIVELALKKFPRAVLNLEEPNPILLAKYKEQVALYPQLSIGIAYGGPIQDYYDHAREQPPAPRPTAGQDLVFAIHMIYHLTHLHDDDIDPDKDIIEAISTMYSLLNTGASVFLVVADQRISTSGLASRYYFEKTGKNSAVAITRRSRTVVFVF